MRNWIVLNRTDLHKNGLALNNLQRSICHKTQQTKPNHLLYWCLKHWIWSRPFTTQTSTIRAIRFCTTFIRESDFWEIDLNVLLCPFQTHLHAYFCQPRLCHWYHWCPDLFRRRQQLFLDTAASLMFLKSAPLFRPVLFTASHFIQYKELRKTNIDWPLT